MLCTIVTYLLRALQHRFRRFFALKSTQGFRAKTTVHYVLQYYGDFLWDPARATNTFTAARQAGMLLEVSTVYQQQRESLLQGEGPAVLSSSTEQFGQGRVALVPGDSLRCTPDGNLYTRYDILPQ